MNSEPSMLGLGWSETEVRHFVGECYDRDTNLSVLLGFSEKYLEKRMILILGKKILQPFMIQGWEERSAEVLKSARISRGDIETTLGDSDGKHYTDLFDALKFEVEPQLFTIPIPIGNRVTTMILGVPKEDADFASLAEIAKFVGTQLEKLIRLSKTGELPPKKDRIPASPIRNKTDSDVSNETLQAYVLAATAVDVPIVPKLVEQDSEGEIRQTVTLEKGFSSSSKMDESPFRVVSESSEMDDQNNDAGSTSNFGLPNVEQISEISFARRSSILEEDSGDTGHTQIAFSSDFKFATSNGVAEESSLGESSIGESSTSESSMSEPSTGVSIMIPKQVTEETSHATLMGGIGVASDLVEKSLRETAANPSISIPRGDLKRKTPGAAIFRARKKSGKVGGFIPQATTKMTTVPSMSAPELTESRQTMEMAEFPKPEEDNQTLAADTNPQLPQNVVSELKRKIADSDDLEKWDIKDDSEDLGSWTDDDVLDPAVFDNLTPTGELSVAAKSIILESGPLVVENQEYFMMIDSRDKGVAFSAAEKIAELGQPALAFLDSIFPGRIFVDRYQFTAETMPNASLHTPVLDCLTNIGTEEALNVPMNYLDDKSTETRFYAIFLLLNFEVGDRIGEIYERFFDKDPQIQNVAKLVLGKAKETSGFSAIIDRLRNEIQFSQKDHRVEIACDILAVMKDRQSVELLIDLLEEQKGRTQTRIHNALQILTLKDWSTPYEWRQWWREANAEPRSEWLITALDSNSEFIRKAAEKELQQIPGLSLNYHIMQPSKLRRRAQRELRSWFEA